MSEELTAKKRSALNRLKTVRGHLDGIIRMLESDAYCVDVMKQISAVQSALERTNRVMLHNHLETCFSEAVVGGQGETAIAELVDALKFSPALTGPDTCLNGTTTDEAVKARYVVAELCHLILISSWRVFSCRIDGPAEAAPRARRCGPMSLPESRRSQSGDRPPLRALRRSARCATQSGSETSIPLRHAAR